MSSLRPVGALYVAPQSGCIFSRSIVPRQETTLFMIFLFCHEMRVRFCSPNFFPTDALTAHFIACCQSGAAVQRSRMRVGLGPSRINSGDVAGILIVLRVLGWGGSAERSVNAMPLARAATTALDDWKC